MNRDLDRLRHTHPRLRYIAEEGLGHGRGQNIEGYLIHHAYLALDQLYDDSRLLLFGTKDAGSTRPVDARFGQRIRLTNKATLRHVQPGDVLPLHLQWQATGAMDQQPKVFVHLLRNEEEIVAQRDSEPVAGLRPTNTWLPGERITDRRGVLIPKNAPAGPAQLYVGLYDPATGERLPASQAGQPVGDRLLLALITIHPD